MSSNRIMTVSRAISEAIAQEMRADPSVFVMGEDVGPTAASSRDRRPARRFGEERVRARDLEPASSAASAPMAGRRPIVELMFVASRLCMTRSTISRQGFLFSAANASAMSS